MKIRLQPKDKATQIQMRQDSTQRILAWDRQGQARKRLEALKQKSNMQRVVPMNTSQRAQGSFPAPKIYETKTFDAPHSPQTKE
jgi:hypothetical protein